MRRKIVAGNWKMNTLLLEGENLVKELLEFTDETEPAAEIVVCPPFTHLYSIGKITGVNYEGKQNIKLGAQNCSEYEKGAYTGEISAGMLKSISCNYVILGHSERREYFGENGEILRNKIFQVLDNGMIPIFCVGEKLEDRESKLEFEVVSEQLKEVLYNLKGAQMERVVVAYEPVWAIGTGRTASSAQAEEMHAYIRKVIFDKFGKIADEISILYGGSCKPSNAKELFSMPNVDGGLIGGASLVASDFIQIINSFGGDSVQSL